MSARDKYHLNLKDALKKDGWEITHDPYIIETQGVNYQVDLGAEKIIAAQKGKEKIAIEIKSFLKDSTVSEFHTALGQFLNYKLGLEEVEKDRILYLAIPNLAYNRIKKLGILMKSINRYEVRLIVFNIQEKTIISWIK